MTRRHTIWLGAAGTVTAQGVARRVRSAWAASVALVAADINPASLVAAADLADATERVPPVADRAAFVDALQAGVRRHGVDTYVPLLVEEIAIAAELKAAGALAGVSVLAPSPRTARLCTDKLALAAELERHGIATPPTVAATEARWWPEGVLVKARTGEGSRLVSVIRRPEELASIRVRGEDAVAQRRCRGPEVTVDAVRGQRSELWLAVCRERLEVRAGVCTKARLFRDEQLEALVRHVAQALELRGALCVQAMRGPAGWEITDVNPRCGGGTAMSAAVGVDVIAAALADLWGENPRPYLTPHHGEAHVVRSYVESVRQLVPVAVDLDGTLLDCRARQVQLALHVAPGLDAERFWRDKRSGASTLAAFAAQERPGAEREADAWTAAVEDPEWLELDAVLPAAHAALAELRRRGARPLVITARRSADAVRRQVAERFGGELSEVHVVSPADAAGAKAALLAELGVHGFVGDTESDALAAKHAGVPFAAVESGQRSRAFLAGRGLTVEADALGAVRRLLA